MANETGSSGSTNNFKVVIEVNPIAEEEDDLSAIALVEHAQDELQQVLHQREGYTVQTLPRDPSQQAARGIDVILLVTMLTTIVASSKDILANFFDLLTTTLEVISKRGRVQEIQIIADGKTLILHDVSKKTAKELIETFEAQLPGSASIIASSKKVQVQAKISRSNKR
jgi:hypothetical protein